MKESDRMLERAQLEIILKDFSNEQRKTIENQINELKIILNSEIISLETIALIIFLYRKNNENILQ